MGNKSQPRTPDEIDYYLIVPQRATLYGGDTVPSRWLRVIDKRGNGGRYSHEYLDDPEDPSSMINLETVDIETFIEFATYGYTPYVECMLSGLKIGFDFDKYNTYFLSQAVYRGYEQRCRTLLQICKDKKYSASTLFGSDAAAELVAETKGALACWEMLMNNGTMRTFDCLEYLATPSSRFGIPLAKLESKFIEMQDRMLTSNCANLPYKITPDKRETFVHAFN